MSSVLLMASSASCQKEEKLRAGNVARAAGASEKQQQRRLGLTFTCLIINTSSKRGTSASSCRHRRQTWAKKNKQIDLYENVYHGGRGDRHKGQQRQRQLHGLDLAVALRGLPCLVERTSQIFGAALLLAQAPDLGLLSIVEEERCERAA